MNVTHYGQLSSEKTAFENNQCRQIVKEIVNFGITQRQMLLVAYFLAQELENVEHMQLLTTMIRELREDLFVIGESQPMQMEKENNG